MYSTSLWWNKSVRSAYSGSMATVIIGYVVHCKKKTRDILEFTRENKVYSSRCVLWSRRTLTYSQISSCQSVQFYHWFFRFWSKFLAAFSNISIINGNNLFFSEKHSSLIDTWQKMTKQMTLYRSFSFLTMVKKYIKKNPAFEAVRNKRIMKK